MNQMEHFPLEFSKPFAICFKLLAKANISIHEPKRSIWNKLRSVVLLACYVTFYISLTVSFSKILKGELGFYDLANLLPIFIVATQGGKETNTFIRSLATLLPSTNEFMNQSSVRALRVFSIVAVFLVENIFCSTCRRYLSRSLLRLWTFYILSYFSLLLYLTGAMKGIVIITNLAKAKTLIDELGALWRIAGLTRKQLDRKTMMLKRLNLCNSVFYWMNIVGTWQYILVPLFETSFLTFILGQDKLLYPFICTFPFDETQNWLVYLMTYFYESYSMLHLIYMYLGVEFLMITLCSHLATEFEMLREEMLHSVPILENAVSSDYVNSSQGRVCIERDSLTGNDIVSEERSETDDDIRRDEDGPAIKDVIRRHQKLILLSEYLDDIFNKMIFFNLLFATITICFFGFVAKIARDPPEMANNFVGVVASMIPIFNLCYYAEMLSGASAGVADSAYHNLWYEGNIRYRKIIIFIIVRSQKACSLTSMRYSPVTLNTFTTVLSTTWSYFSLAISMYETEK